MPGLTGLSGLSGLSGLTGSYVEKVLGYGPIAYWPLYETSGATANCLVNSAQDGSYTGVTLGQTVTDANGVTIVCPLFDGANDWVNVFSATFASAFNDTEGSIFLWVRFFNVGVWTDGQARRAFDFRRDGSNRLYTGKAVNNAYDLVHEGTGVQQAGRYNTTSVVWFHWGMTWSATDGAIEYYVDGSNFASDPGPTAWAGAMVQAAVGAISGPSNHFYGWLAHVAVWDTPLTQPQITDLATV